MLLGGKKKTPLRLTLIKMFICLCAYYIFNYNKMKKTNNTTLSKHFQNPIKKIIERGKIDTTCIHKYTKIQFPDLLHALQ